MFVNETGARALSSSELALVSGGNLFAPIATVAIGGASMAMDYDTYCGNGLKPIPHFSATAMFVAAGI